MDGSWRRLWMHATYRFRPTLLRRRVIKHAFKTSLGTVLAWVLAAALAAATLAPCMQPRGEFEARTSWLAFSQRATQGSVSTIGICSRNGYYSDIVQVSYYCTSV